MARPSLRLVLLVAALAPAACVGDLEVPRTDDVPAPVAADAAAPEDARAMFAASVQPIVARCAGASCHTGSGAPLKFLGGVDPTDDYDALVSHPSITGGFEPSLANMLLKIDAGGHYGQTYTAMERASIVAWLEAEGDERGGAGGALEPEEEASPLAVWAGCMTKASWDAAGMGTWSDKPTDDGDVCSTCHNDGAYRFNTNDDDDQMFSLNRTELYVIGFFTVDVSAEGTQTVAPAAAKLTRMGNGSTLHPRFGYGGGDEYMQRLVDFHERTRATLEAGQCGPAGFYIP